MLFAFIFNSNATHVHCNLHAGGKSNEDWICIAGFTCTKCSLRFTSDFHPIMYYSWSLWFVGCRSTHIHLGSLRWWSSSTAAEVSSGRKSVDRSSDSDWTLVHGLDTAHSSRTSSEHVVCFVCSFGDVLSLTRWEGGWAFASLRE